MSVIEITGKDNQAVKEAVKLCASAKERREQGKYIIEGMRLCEEALEHGKALLEVFYTQKAYDYNETLCEKLAKKCEKVYKITDEIAEKIADTVSPQGIFVIGKQSGHTIDFENVEPTGQYVLLENVQDPGNVGTIFRTAEAFGLSGVILSNDCCDPYNPKALRGAMGAIFRMPFLISDNVCELMTYAKTKNMRPIAAVPDSTVSKIMAVRFFKGVIMCVGNEGNGLSEELISMCGERVTIPMNGRAESLNAATASAILMWEMVRNY